MENLNPTAINRIAEEKSFGCKISIFPGALMDL
jgi:hypothetical protein